MVCSDAFVSIYYEQFKLFNHVVVNNVIPLTYYLCFSEPETVKVRKIENSFTQKVNLSLHTSHQYLKSKSDKGYIVNWPSTDEVFVFSEQITVFKLNQVES